MTDDSDSAGAFRPIVLLGTAVLVVLLSWHYICHLRLEAGLQERASDYLQTAALGVDAIIRVNPLTNVVQVELGLPMDEAEPSARIIGDAAAAYVNATLAPEFERRLSTAARSYMDLYAMAVPYRVSIEFAMVGDESSRLVKDIQTELIRLGYDIGSVDGVNGPKTRSAISDVQIQLRMPADGTPSRKLLETLRIAKPGRPRSQQ